MIKFSRLAVAAAAALSLQAHALVIDDSTVVSLAPKTASSAVEVSGRTRLLIINLTSSAASATCSLSESGGLVPVGMDESSRQCPEMGFSD